MQLNKSSKFLIYTSFVSALNDALSRHHSNPMVTVDYTIHQGEIGLMVKQDGDKDPRTVVLSFNNADVLSVTYFSHLSMISNRFDPYGLKAKFKDPQNPEEMVCEEYRHRNIGRQEGPDFSAQKRLIELAMFAMHFLKTGELQDDVTVKAMWPDMAPTILSHKPAVVA